MENLPNDAISLPSRVFYSNDSTRVYVGFPDEFIELARYLDIPTKTSDLTNDSGFVTSSGVTSVSGTANEIVSTGGTTPVLSLHTNVTTSLSLANTAVQPSELNNYIKTYYIDISLDKTDINNLHTTPITITSTDLGLGVGQVAKFLKELLEVRIFTDGTDFSSTRPIQIGNGELNDIMSLDNSLYASALPDGTYAGGGMTSFLTYKVKDEYYITVADPITGGGDACYIKFRIYYHIVDSW